jgi:hypothetical protein
VAGAFLCFLLVFFEGVLENVRFLGGVFVVSLWWIDGELWVGWRLFCGGLKTCQSFEIFFGWLRLITEL